MTYLLCGRMEVPHLMSIRSVECWLATLNASSAILSHALEPMKAARIGVIYHSALSKLSTFCLHGYSVSFCKIQRSSTFFSVATFATRPKNVPFLFLMASSLVLSVLRHGLETSNLGDVSAQELWSSKRGLLTRTSWN